MAPLAGSAGGWGLPQARPVNFPGCGAVAAGSREVTA